MDYKDKYEGLCEDVARLLTDFKEELNKDHGEYLLKEWDKIRSIYYDPKDFS